MSWSSDDARLASVGVGGACYQWDVLGGVKIAEEEYVDKQMNYCWVEFCSNNSTSGVVVRSLDGKLQHIQVSVLHIVPFLTASSGDFTDTLPPSLCAWCTALTWKRKAASQLFAQASEEQRKKETKRLRCRA